jgi:hypothetical protein
VVTGYPIPDKERRAIEKRNSDYPIARHDLEGMLEYMENRDPVPQPPQDLFPPPETDWDEQIRMNSV